MFDYLVSYNSTGDPTALSILITVLFSFFLSSLIVITYDFTSRSVDRQINFLQSLALISIIAATVMQAIGDSLARGLGMLGALSIIRFRTRLDNPRNMTFMFASLAVGIATGVFGFTIAFIGTIGFCIGAILLKYTPMFSVKEMIGSLMIEVPKEGDHDQLVYKILKLYCKHFELEQIRFINTRKKEKIKNEEGNIVAEISKDHLKELHYQIRLRTDTKAEDFAREVEKIDDIGDIRLRFDKKDLQL